MIEIAEWVCIPCGVKYLTEKEKKEGNPVTAHKGVCCECKQEKLVVHIRNYHYLNKPQPEQSK